VVETSQPLLPIGMKTPISMRCSSVMEWSDLQESKTRTAVGLRFVRDGGEAADCTNRQPYEGAAQDRIRA